MRVTNPLSLKALAERCEQASGPDVELDLDISEATKACQRNDSWKAFRPTASLDAAMTLVPEGQQFGCGSQDATRRAWAWVGEGGPLDEPYKSMLPANAATPALALCAASLRARAAGEPQ